MDQIEMAVGDGIEGSWKQRGPPHEMRSSAGAYEPQGRLGWDLNSPPFQVDDVAGGDGAIQDLTDCAHLCGTEQERS
jgi:hypothetical protein